MRDHAKCQMTDEETIYLGKILNYIETESKQRITTKRRSRHLVFLRVTFSMLALKTHVISYSNIGRVIKRDHATILHYKKLKDEVFSIKYYRDLYNHFLNIDNSFEDEDTILRKQLIKDLLRENKNLKKRNKFLRDAPKYTENEKAYRQLSEEQKRVYDLQASAKLKMMFIKQNQTTTIYNCAS